jgi:hypothetical protein
MRNFLTQPLLWTVLAFWGVAHLIGQALGPATCRDGWDSPSIRSRGACSWHGGVDHSHTVLARLGGLVAGAGAFVLTLGIREVGKPAQPERAPVRPPAAPTLPTTTTTYAGYSSHRPPRPGEPGCPNCGGLMLKRVARRGRWSGQSFWGCAGYPHCRGTRTYSAPIGGA